MDCTHDSEAGHSLSLVGASERKEEDLQMAQPTTVMGSRICSARVVTQLIICTVKQQRNLSYARHSASLSCPVQDLQVEFAL